MEDHLPKFPPVCGAWASRANESSSPLGIPTARLIAPPNLRHDYAVGPRAASGTALKLPAQSSLVRRNVTDLSTLIWPQIEFYATCARPSASSACQAAGGQPEVTE